MSDNTFDDFCRELLDRIGDGNLTGAVEVDQIYAAYQHNGLDFRHPRGGQALYLTTPLLEKHPKYLQEIADAVFGSNKPLWEAMANQMEALSNEVYELAPREFWDLRASGHPTVKDGAETVYDRPPIVHRLTEQELKAKSRLRNLGF